MIAPNYDKRPYDPDDSREPDPFEDYLKFLNRQKTLGDRAWAVCGICFLIVFAGLVYVLIAGP